MRPSYACGCLNVRITPLPANFPNSPDPAATPDFTQVHVADEGISVAHPQVTLRIRTRGELASGHRRARYTSLTCLLCQVLVYRVHQIVSIDSDTRDGPLMPTEDWVEQDLLKSPSGWIEVHKDCLNGDAIARVEASQQYSTLFSLAIPVPGSPPASPQPAIEDGPQVAYLAHLPPLFLPPPFTPAHPVFVHLSSLATKESEAQRAAVESYMAHVMRAKSAELAQTESRLRRQVETVWRKFRAGLESVEQVDTSALASPRSPRSPRSPASRATSGNLTTPASPTGAGTPIAVVRDFIPLPVAPIRQQHAPAVSSSLLTSGFHAPPRQQQPPQPPTPVQPESPRPSSSSSRTLGSSSPTLAGSPRAQVTAPRRIFEDGASVLQFPRTQDEDLNTAASLRLFEGLEADMARHKRERERQLRESQKASTSTAAAADDTAPGAGPSTVNGNAEKHTAKNGAAGSLPKGVESRGETSVPDKGKEKQKKIVTFQSQPAVVTIKREVNAEKEEEVRFARNDGEEMIFDLEEGNSQESADGAVMVFVEQPLQPRASQPRRPTRKEPTDSTGLPQSFSALRPASLPVPSQITSPRRSPPVNEQAEASIQEEDAADEQDQERDQEEEQYDSRDVQIRKLVAADTFSHRGKWRKSSDEWKTMVSDGRRGEEDEEDDELGPPPPPHLNGSSLAGMPGSMPIAIRPLVKPPTVLNLASYRPQTMPTVPQEPEQEPLTPVSSSAIRKAVYAERDLQRAMDPGALDFSTNDEAIAEEDEEEGEAPNSGGGAVSAAGSAPGRLANKRAFSILQARNELPDSGMWRSLAS
ncbi:hypothetical protein DFH07DRAFT_879688 [Mycena maculata]|uniref:Uncharacterized protein n=1 Tax=Mycena maculata TaxID=230809 RepID=A0AAD7JUZ9_9AGAR|nr:hypothetical protein DFH07DRAFT_879688 [Mycena maculata]